MYLFQSNNCHIGFISIHKVSQLAYKWYFVHYNISFLVCLAGSHFISLILWRNRHKYAFLNRCISKTMSRRNYFIWHFKNNCSFIWGKALQSGLYHLLFYKVPHSVYMFYRGKNVGREMTWLIKGRCCIWIRTVCFLSLCFQLVYLAALQMCAHFLVLIWTWVLLL